MADRIESVFVFGDSNAAGVGAYRRRGWLQQLGETFYDRGGGGRGPRGRHFYDLSFPGATAETFLEQVRGGEVTRRYKGYGGILSIIAIGAQDISVNFRDARGPQEQELYAKYMATAIGELASLGDLLYVGIPCPDLDFMQRAARQKGYTSPVQDIVLGYEAGTAYAVTAAAEQEERLSEIVPLFSATGADPQYSVSADHIHPDDTGHARVLEIVRPVFESMVELRHDNQ